jgi:hypothetical protein
MRLIRNDMPIVSLEDWRAHAAPKGGDRHWVEGRSALELARAWCSDEGPCVPAEVRVALQSHPDLAALRIIEMTPEARIAFDKRRGEPRNADLAGIAEDGDGIAVIQVEGKADESFGERVADVLSAATRRARGKTTGAPDRVRDLISALVPRNGEEQPSADDLRYQLLTATAATLAEAQRRGATRAVLVIHEFVTDRTDDNLHHANQSDLNAFVRRISNGRIAGITSGQAVGPIRVIGAPLITSPVSLYIVKATRFKRERKSPSTRD